MKTENFFGHGKQHQVRVAVAEACPLTVRGMQRAKFGDGVTNIPQFVRVSVSL